MSLVNVYDAEWRTRKINLFSVIRSFISQLRPGQDLTKISLPAELCHPFTMLEVIGFRELTTLHTIFGVNAHSDNPLERFIYVLRFFLSTIRQEQFEKKPFNPVLGENHIAWIVNDNPQDGITEFIGEQVSHHPPISAFIVRNTNHQVEVTGNISFSVKFGQNYVAVSTSGAEFVTLGKFNERYELTKCLPDMVVRNVIWGTKYCMWEGKITLECPSTGYSATMVFEEKKKENILKGTINHIDQNEPLFEIRGVCGAPIYLYKPDQPDFKRLVIDVSKEKFGEVSYLPKEHLDPLASVVVWKKVYDAIIIGDMVLADKEKKIVEQEQRDRSKARNMSGKTNTGMYFDLDNAGNWIFKNNISLIKYLESPNTYQLPRSDGRQQNSSSTATATASPSPSASASPSASSAAAAAVAIPSVTVTSATASAAASAAATPLEPTDQIVSNARTEPSAAAAVAPSPRVKKSRTKEQSQNKQTLPVVAEGALSDPESALSDEDQSTSKSSLNVEALIDQDVSMRRNSSDTIPRRRSNKSHGASTLPPPVITSPMLTSSPSKLSKTELKIEKKKMREEQKTMYQKVKLEKKKNSELLTQSALPSICSGMVKMRNSLKKWSPKWVVLQPGRLIYYKSKADVAKDSCSGILNLAGCEVKPRPSKKPGFCFKIFHVAQHPIYAKQGLKGETLKKAFLPVGADYCIMRVNDEKEGLQWIENIKRAVPDYDKVMALKAAEPDDSDSDDDEEEEEGPEYGDDGSIPSVKANDFKEESLLSSTASASSQPNVPPSPGPATTSGQKSKPPVDIRDVFKQMGALYMTTRKLNSAHAQLVESFEELKKQSSESIEELKKQSNENIEELKKQITEKLAATERTIMFQLKQLSSKQNTNELQQGTKVSLTLALEQNKLNSQ